MTYLSVACVTAITATTTMSCLKTKKVSDGMLGATLGFLPLPLDRISSTHLPEYIPDLQSTMKFLCLHGAYGNAAVSPKKKPMKRYYQLLTKLEL